VGRLGIQRLEETGVLALAHQAMLEDMLECWTVDHVNELRRVMLPFTNSGNGCMAQCCVHACRGSSSTTMD